MLTTRWGGYVSDTIYCPLDENKFSKFDTIIFLAKKADTESTIKLCEKIREKGDPDKGYRIYSNELYDYFDKHCRN